MSWFYGKGLTNLATTAIKEAQKKIDQVFDIRDEDDDGNSNDYICGDGDSNDGISDTHSIVSSNVNDVINKGIRKLNAENARETFMPSNKENQMITTPPKPGEMVKQVYDLNVKPQTREQKKDQDLLGKNVIIDTVNVAKPSPSIDDNINSNIRIMGATDESVINESETILLKEEDKVETPRPSSAISIDCQPVTLIEKPANELQAIDSDSTYSFEDIQMVHLTDGSMELELPTTSPHSNDELETTTSSDIEIISNPNGDGSSSTNSNIAHRSPLKLIKCTELANLQQHSTDSTAVATTAIAANPTTVSSTVNTAASDNLESRYKGHCREPSEVSILSVDSRSEDELEKLINRMAELNNTIEALELRLLESSRQNCALQEQNKELQAMVNDNKQQQQSSDEYMKRLSSLEKKFQASKQECNILRSTIRELQNKLTKTDLTEAFNESQEIVAELKQEGEKLSKEILQQSNIIKKLRSKEKMTDVQLKTHKDQLIAAHEEIERLKKTLGAREDMERSQIEAVNKLSSDNQKLEKEKAQLNSKLEDITQKLNTLQHSFNAVKSELQQRSKQHTDLTKTTEIMQALEKENAVIQAENQEFQRQLHKLRENLRLSEQAAIQREQRLRDENRQLISRCEIAELRAESSTQEMSQTTIPLMRQLESLQETLNQRSCNWNQEEKQLLEKMETYQKRLQVLESAEATVKEENVALKIHCTELEEKLRHTAMQGENIKINYQLEMKQNEIQYNKRITALTKDLEIADTKIKLFTEKEQQLQYKLEHCENELSKLQRNATNTDDNANANTNVHELNFDCINSQVKHEQRPQAQQQQSPRTSASHNSFDDAMGVSIDWREDDLECVSNPSRPLSIPGIGLCALISQNSAGTLEHLQSLLKQKDGEITQCQWEISRLNAERNILQDEMSQLTLELEQMTEKLQNYEALENNYNDLQTRYDALLQMYGEKVERTEELELDLKECKEAYKTQIQELLIKLKT